MKLANTKIETDSYVAVQLLEKSGKLDFDGLRFMSEALEGSFTITVLSDQDNLYIAKGNNPIVVQHFPDSKLYVYASTEEILQKALRKTSLSFGRAERVNVYSGELLRIDASGKVSRCHFDDSNLYNAFMLPWTHCSGHEPVRRPYADCTDYLDNLKAVAIYFGIFPEDVDALIEDGMTPDEIEEFLYCG